MPAPAAAVAPFPGPHPGFSGPVAALRFGMDAHQVWEAIPAFRDAITVRLPPEAFEAFAAAHPDVRADPTRISSGGNRWVRHTSRTCRWLEADGGRWCVEVSEQGLDRVRLDYPSDPAGTLARAWGPAPLAERWSIWLDREAGVRVADTGCFTNDTGTECSIEIMPFRPVGEVVRRAVAPGTLGAPRSTFPAGEPADDDVERYRLPPYEVSSGFVPVELRVKDGVVVGWRTRLDWTYALSFQGRVESALDAVLGPSTTTDAEGCRTWTTPPAKACPDRSSVLVVVGAWD